MIRENEIDESLNHLLAFFGRRVHVRPPASAAGLADLEELAGPLPRDLTIFLATCNGIRVQLEGPGDGFHLSCIHEIGAVLRDRQIPAGNAELLIRGDPFAEGDWLVVERGPLYGCVIRRHPWTAGAKLLSSSFGAYLASWVDYLIENFDHAGRRRLDRLHPRFDPATPNRKDIEANRHSQDPTVREWLHKLDLAVPSGDDFE
jgi:hypothetical protein